MTIPYFAILIASVVGFAIGAVWYMSLSAHWLPTQQWSAEQRAHMMGDGRKNPTPFIVSFIGLLLMATVLAGLIGHTGRSGAGAGAMIGLLCWLGFVATTFATSYAYSLRPLKGWAIDVGHYLLVLLAQGAIIGWWMAR